MVLSVGAGFGARLLAGFESGPWVGLLIGLVVAPLIPSKRSCGVRFRDPAPRPDAPAEEKG